MTKKIKVIFEMPENWLDEDQASRYSLVASWFRENIQRNAQQQAVVKLVEKILSKTKLPKVKPITAEELKKALLDRQVQDFIDSQREQ